MSASSATASPLVNTQARYGSVTRFFHWLTALLILTLIPLGIIANGLPYETNEELAQKALLFSLHKTLGLAMFFVALARIGWAISQAKPAPLHPGRKAETFLAELVHWLLYASLVLVPLTGWIHHAATTGFAPIWWPFGQSLPFVPKDDTTAHTFAALHIIFERVLVLSILLHVIGALKHHFFDKDGTLRRMWAGANSQPPARGGKSHGKTPLGAAMGIYAVALAIGAGLGLFEGETRAAPGPALEAVAPDWQVQDGTLGLTITQFGNSVSGSFEDWTAAIRFDENATGVMGDVEVTIAIGSVTLGSVTSQALGGDFFDAATFPTATFQADLARDPAGAGYLADGTLTLKGVAMPLALPFTLTVEDGIATMQARTMLDRRDFAIGDTMGDEANLAFTVAVEIALTARRMAD